MLQLKHPGIYTEELPSGNRAITGASTSVALFVGPTRTGPDGRRTRIQSFGDFETLYGGISPTSNLSYAVLHFFANGGGEAFVIRVPPSGSSQASTQVIRDAAGTNTSITLTALSSGVGGNNIFFELDSFGIDAGPFESGANKKLFNLTVTDPTTGLVERFTRISTDATNARFAETVVSDPATGSSLVSLKVPAASIDQNGPQANGTVYKLKNGLPTGATFGTNVVVKLEIDVRDPAGTVQAGLSTSIDNIIVYEGTDAKPASVLELVGKLTGVLNEKLRSTPALVTAMEGVGVEVAAFEGGAFIRLRTTPPDGKPRSQRLQDATVRLSDATGAGTPFLTTFFAASPQKIANPSRYRLGASYASSQIAISAVAPITPVAGVDGNVNGQPTSAAFKQAVMDLDKPDPFFNTLCLPDAVRPLATDPNALLHTNAMAIYGEAARICENKHALLLIDPFPDVKTTGVAENWKSTRFTFQSDHSAVFFPNIRVDDPAVPGAIRACPPSGAMAGVIARTDAQYGVWQSPAGTEASINGAYGPSVVLSDAEHGILNPLGLNVIRQFPIYGTVNFGSRTLDGSNAQASDWKYIAPRRTADYIFRSLMEGLRWAIHKPNGEQLWAQLRISVTAFMHGMFVQGAFKGVSPRQAYFVLCDASTTSQADIDLGAVNILVGFAPLKPAEFVIVKLRQIVQPAV